MGILERIEEKLDIIMQRLQVDDEQEKVTPVRQKRRYDDEISNCAISQHLGLPYIGNVEFCRVADAAGINVTYHGTHPYIKKSCMDLWIKTFTNV